jgi:hypothetical protein
MGGCALVSPRFTVQLLAWGGCPRERERVGASASWYRSVKRPRGGWEGSRGRQACSRSSVTRRATPSAPASRSTQTETVSRRRWNDDLVEVPVADDDVPKAAAVEVASLARER